VLEIVKAGGILMLPIMLCSVIALAVSVERLWSLRRKCVLPDGVSTRARQLLSGKQISEQKILAMKTDSPLGEVLSVVLAKRHQGRDQIVRAVEDVGRQVAHRLQRYLNALGTIAAITPLLGLLGTVVGMIAVFTKITGAGVGNAGELAGGISQALITTAAGLTVAIPAFVMHRYLRARVDGLILEMEQQTLSVIEDLRPGNSGTARPLAPNRSATASGNSAGRARALAGVDG